MNNISEMEQAIKAFRLAIFASAAVILASSIMWATLALYVIPHVITQAINENLTGTYSIQNDLNPTN